MLYFGFRNGKEGFYREKWKGKKRKFRNSDWSKYEGEINNGEPNGQGTQTYYNGEMYVGEYKNGYEWNGTYYDRNGKILYKRVNGEVIEQ